MHFPILKKHNVWINICFVVFLVSVYSNNARHFYELLIDCFSFSSSLRFVVVGFSILILINIFFFYFCIIFFNTFFKLNLFKLLQFSWIFFHFTQEGVLYQFPSDFQVLVFSLWRRAFEDQKIWAFVGVYFVVVITIFLYFFCFIYML